MLNYTQAYNKLKTALLDVYDEREASAIAHEALTYITGADKLQRITNRDKELTPEQFEQYAHFREKLQEGMPLQYLTGTTWFKGMEFRVNEHVLIPRPETEELVDLIVSDYKEKQPDILDIGTGSGCIPITLAKALPQANITSIDISKEAIATAKENALLNNADINFLNIDFLDEAEQRKLPEYDIIVSNPPYIPEEEKTQLHTNVRDHEPGLALFVPDDDALLFYRHIAEFGRSHLKTNGRIYCELHIDYATETGTLFKNMDYTNVIVKEDMHGNMRMLRASL